LYLLISHPSTLWRSKSHSSEKDHLQSGHVRIFLKQFLVWRLHKPLFEKTRWQIKQVKLGRVWIAFRIFFVISNFFGISIFLRRSEFKLFFQKIKLLFISSTQNRKTQKKKPNITFSVSQMFKIISSLCFFEFFFKKSLIVLKKKKRENEKNSRDFPQIFEKWEKFPNWKKKT
jgi:hypothetical protein